MVMANGSKTTSVLSPAKRELLSRLRSKQGRQAEGRTALQRYLTMAPNAPDAPFVRQMIQS